MTSYRKFSQAAENNQQPILEKLRQHFTAPGCVLEIGSGSGQHAVRFGAELPHLNWQPTEQPEQVADLEANLAAFASGNVRDPLPLTVGGRWPPGSYHYGFLANVLHIMPEENMHPLFQGLDISLIPGAVLCLYGPFKYQGNYTSDSNAKFDEWLGSQYAGGGIRDFEQVVDAAVEHGCSLVVDHSMPANNQLLVFSKR